MREKTMILHIDADAFFVACEVARLPELKGKPVIVGGERGIACAMSYEAKALGVTRGMPTFQIKKEFPQVTILPAHFALYYSYRDNLISFLRDRFETIEVYSIDECFLEVSSHELTFSHKALENLRDEIEQVLGIPYSLGLARTKTLAKIASKKNKPRGACLLSEEIERSAIESLTVGSVWGIGRRSVETLTKLSITTIRDLLLADDTVLQRHFSVPLLRTKKELLGQRVIAFESVKRVRKEMQVTRSFQRTNDSSFVLSELSTNIEELCVRLQKEELETMSLSIWIKEMKGGKEIYHRAEYSLSLASSNIKLLMQTISPFYDKIRKDERGVMRATGVCAQTILKDRDRQCSLFEDTASDTDNMTEILSSLQSKFGSNHIMTAGSMQAKSQRTVDQKRYDKESAYLADLPYPYLGIAS